jgi:hypothetical protein
VSAVALRHLPVPDCLPPLETDPAVLPTGPTGPGGRPQGVQGVLSLVVDDATALGEDEVDFGPVPTPSADLPEPRAWSRGLVQVLVEVMAGLRPASQLLRWTTTAVHEDIRALVRPTVRGRRPAVRRPVVRSVRVCEPADGVAEVSAVVAGEHRTRALALRLEGGDGRWRITALQAG